MSCVGGLAVILLVLCSGDWKTNVEYGDPYELTGVERLFVWTTTEDKALGEEAARQMAAALPALSLVQSEEEGQAVLGVKRRPAVAKPGDESTHYVTTASVMRPSGKDRVRLLFELVSTQDDGTAAVTELVSGVVNELKRYNHHKYGRAENTGDLEKKRCRSIAGLRPGLSKNEVKEILGMPTRMFPKAARTQTWWYETTDGTVRIVFAGDAVMHVEVTPKK
ncbi:MAG: hypothetical protein NDJ92_17335 [Thermoanaerobaculia bacterium]|nr:hypothetical protein [Thermoanaerobaculia bacterium]